MGFLFHHNHFSVHLYPVARPQLGAFAVFQFPIQLYAAFFHDLFGMSAGFSDAEDFEELNELDEFTFDFEIFHF